MTKKNALLGAIAFTLSFAVVAAEPAKKAPAVKAGEPDILKHAAHLTPYPIKQCPPGAQACVVHVTVTPMKGGKCTIAPEAGMVKIDPGMTVLWKLDKPWAFDKSGGIQFKDAKAPFESQQLSEQVWQAKSAKTAAPGVYSYGIKVSNGTVSCSIDPGIWI